MPLLRLNSVFEVGASVVAALATMLDDFNVILDSIKHSPSIAAVQRQG